MLTKGTQKSGQLLWLMQDIVELFKLGKGLPQPCQFWDLNTQPSVLY